MAFANRISCYVCNRHFQLRLTIRLDEDNNIDVLNIANFRRQAAGHPAELRNIENDPNCLRLNVLIPHSVRGGIICNAQVNIRKLLAVCRANIFLVSNIYVPEYLKICDIHLNHSGALLNKFHPLINLPGTMDIAVEILNKLDDVNIIQARVEAQNLTTRNGRWRRLNHMHIPEFPRVEINFLKDLVGSYHIYLSPSYIQDKLQREENNVLEIDEFREENNFLRFRIYSRFRNATKYMLWLAYEEELNENIDPIFYYYCTCPCGSRTLSTCAHVASVLWFLGYARHQNNIRFPTTRLLNSIDDAADRLYPENIDLGPIVEEN
ncbi:unnamed protein product [Psylliodes chrysocephalus]|uniref:SWIM-type domain-containing protein n=1 Tax=Psylliodes chrysocephalus TaxID=3402493 RepID=A0A9P0CKI5_9CUCU|nr:unnamed protein product [Psylliodes chrysocephala]